MANISDTVKANIITWLILLMAGGLFAGAQVNNQKAQRSVKKTESKTTVMQKKVDSVCMEQKLNRKDIDTILFRIPQIYESQHKVEREVSEIKGMLEILISLQKKGAS